MSWRDILSQLVQSPTPGASEHLGCLRHGGAGLSADRQPAGARACVLTTGGPAQRRRRRRRPPRSR